MSSENNNSQRSATYSKRGNAQAKSNRKRFQPRKRTSECEDDGTCDLCVQTIKVYALGQCDHPICYRCSGKMRVLCEEMQCAVCRVEMNKVIYSSSKRSFGELNGLKLITSEKKDIRFTDDNVKIEYEKLFEHSCSLCPDQPPEKTFKLLEAHMSKKHKLFYCHLCVKFNKNFTDECKTYCREDLSKHRRKGDEDDSSHKGHPLCEFCDERYLDNDTLLKHLRTDHYFCHFCDRDGKNQYYDDYDDLRRHYDKEHYLCVEGDCVNEKFTSVFATELDLKAHRSTDHAQGMTRQQQKIERNIDLGFQYSNPPARGGRAGRNEDYGNGGGRGRGRGRGGADGRNFTKKDEDIELAKALSLSEQQNKKEKTSSKVQVLHPRIERDTKRKPKPEEEELPPNLVDDFPTLGAKKEEKQGAYPTIREEAPKLEPEPSEPQRQQTTAASRFAASVGISSSKISQDDFPTLGSNNKAAAVQPVGIWGGLSSANYSTKKSKSKIPQKPTSINMPQSRFNKSNVNLENKADFPTLGGKSNGLVPGQSAIWGPLSSTPAPVTISKKSKKKKPPPQQKITPVTKTPSPAVGNSYAFSNEETVTIRVGKHSMRLPSARNNAEIEDIEKPVEVPGFSGGTSVKTVSADAFSLLSNSSRSTHSSMTGSKPMPQIIDFPELGGAGGNRIKGIGSSKTQWGKSDNNKNEKKKNSKKKFSLSDISNDIFPSSTIENNLSSTKSQSKKKTPLENTSTSQPSKDDFPEFTKPPPISSYSSNWYDDNNEDVKNICVADALIKASTFKSKETDFPTLGGNGKDTDNLNSGKKKKKKKKNKAQQNVSDLSKHFGAVTIDGNSQNGTGHLDNLLKNEKGDAQKSLSSLLDKNDMFAPVTKNEPIKNDLALSASATENRKVEQQKEVNFEPEHESDSEDEEFVDSRPSEDDINGRNMWLINTIQNLCGTDENFSQFKISSGSFRQGTLSAEKYYEKCRILLGKKYFSMVFQELVDLLPDAKKQETLMRIHNQSF